MSNVILSEERIDCMRRWLAALPAEEWAIRAIPDEYSMADIYSDGGSLVATAYRGVAGDTDSHLKSARFIVAARRDVPDLLAERDTLKAERNVAVQRMHDKEAERLELVEEYRAVCGERDAYHDALRKIEMDSPPDTAEECAEIARAALDGFRSTSRQTAPITAQEPA